MAQRHLDLAPQGRQRRTQLMAHVGREPPLRPERPLDPVEHSVQHGYEVAILLSVGVCGDALIQGARFDPRRLRSDLGNRAHRGPREVPGTDQRRGGAYQDDAEERYQQIPLHAVDERLIKWLLHHARNGQKERGGRQAQPGGHRRREPDREGAVQYAFHTVEARNPGGKEP